jgi:hypothetical protein
MRLANALCRFVEMAVAAPVADDRSEAPLSLGLV